MMKLVYKLQAEDYNFDFPVSCLPVSKLWWLALGSGVLRRVAAVSGQGVPLRAREESQLRSSGGSIFKNSSHIAGGDCLMLWPEQQTGPCNCIALFF